MAKKYEKGYHQKIWGSGIFYESQILILLWLLGHILSSDATSKDKKGLYKIVKFLI